MLYSSSQFKPFAFAKRNERVDWKRIAAIDLERVSREVDYVTLQENIWHITFCSIEQEVDINSVDPNFIKLFKLAQLNIEYLLHSQDYLTNSIKSLEQKLAGAEGLLEAEKQSAAKHQESLAELQKENKRQRKQLENQGLPLSMAQLLSKCPHCPKTFFKPIFLSQHIARRHPNAETVTLPPVTAAPAIDTNIIKELEQEVSQLRKKVADAENLLKEEKMTQQNLKKMIEEWSTKKESELKSAVETWQKEHLQEAVEKFQQEMKGLQEKYQESQKALEELDVKYSKAILHTSHLGQQLSDEPPPPPPPSSSKIPQEEIRDLKVMLKSQLGQMSKEIELKLEEYDVYWKRKLKSLNQQQSTQLNELMETLEQNLRRSSTPVAPADKQIEKLLAICKLQEQQLGDQASQIHKLLFTHSTPLTSPAKVPHIVPTVVSPVLPIQVATSEERKGKKKLKKKVEEGKGGEIRMRVVKENLVRGGEKKVPKDQDYQQLQVTPQGVQRSTRLQKALQTSPALVSGLRAEIDDLVRDKLSTQYGIDAADQALSKEELKEKIKQVNLDRIYLKEKYNNFQDIWHQVAVISNTLTDKKMESIPKPTSMSLPVAVAPAGVPSKPSSTQLRTILKSSSIPIKPGIYSETLILHEHAPKKKKTAPTPSKSVSINLSPTESLESCSEFGKPSTAAVKKPSSKKKTIFDTEGSSSDTQKPSSEKKKTIFDTENSRSVPKKPSLDKKKTSLGTEDSSSDTPKPNSAKMKTSFDTEISSSDKKKKESLDSKNSISDSNKSSFDQKKASLETKNSSSGSPEPMIMEHQEIEEIIMEQRSQEFPVPMVRKILPQKNLYSCPGTPESTPSDSSVGLPAGPHQYRDPKPHLTLSSHDADCTLSDWEDSDSKVEVKITEGGTSVSRLAKELEAKLTLSHHTAPVGGVDTLSRNQINKTADSFTKVEAFSEEESDLDKGSISDLPKSKAPSEPKKQKPFSYWDSDTSLDEILQVD